MRNTIMTIAMVALTFGMNAQKVNNLDIRDIPAKYIEIVSIAKTFKPFKVKVYLDYGQISKMSEIKKGGFFDDKGKQVVFNGTMGVLNFLEQNGYVYVNQYLVSGAGGNVYRTLLLNTNFNK
tara:strand:- start:113 stop:478 length:366 start_codon:yes stop_codon:yes gene_type:complete